MRVGFCSVFLLAACTTVEPPAVVLPNVARARAGPKPAAGACGHGQDLLDDGRCALPRSRAAFGRSHGCYVDRAGGLSCWGSNYIGELGLGDNKRRLAPARVPLKDIVEVSAKAQSTCALSRQGSIWCWGQITGSPVPRLVDGIDPAIQVAVGADHACALLPTGQVNCWGRDKAGQLGDGRGGGDDPASIVLVPGLNDATAISAGPESTCALKESGLVVCWGAWGGRKVQRPAPVTDVAGVRAISIDTRGCALTAAGVSCWGEGAHPLQARPVDGWGGAHGVSVSKEFACAILDDGAIGCLGGGVATGDVGAVRDAKGPLPSVTLQQFRTRRSGKVVSVVTGSMNTCVLDDRDNLLCVGMNDDGQLGIGELGRSTEPRVVPGVERATSVLASHEAGCALDDTGSVWCWGFGTSSMQQRRAPRIAHAVPAQKIDTKGEVVRLLPGFAYGEICAARKDKSLVCFLAGLSPFASLEAQPRAGYPLFEIGLSDVRSAARLPNDAGLLAVLGDGSVVMPNRASIVRGRAPEVDRIEGIADATTVVTVDDMACVLTSAKKVVCFRPPLRTAGKRLDFKELHPALETIAGVGGATDLAGASHAACVLAPDRRVLCFAPGKSRPSEQPAFANTIAFGHGDRLCATQPDGIACGWLDPAAPSSDATPLLAYQRERFVGLRDVSVFNDLSCAVRVDGKVACWGNNEGEGAGSTDRMSSRDPLSVKLP